MVHDGWSFNNVFLNEFVELYQAFCLGNLSPLPELTFQFADYAHWQREWVKSQEAEAQLAYWQQQLSGSPPCWNYRMTARAQQNKLTTALKSG